MCLCSCLCKWDPMCRLPDCFFRSTVCQRHLSSSVCSIRSHSTPTLFLWYWCTDCDWLPQTLRNTLLFFFFFSRIIIIIWHYNRCSQDRLLVSAVLSCSRYPFDLAVLLLGIHNKEIILYFMICYLLPNCPTTGRLCWFISLPVKGCLSVILSFGVLNVVCRFF